MSACWRNTPGAPPTERSYVSFGRRVPSHRTRRRFFAAGADASCAETLRNFCRAPQFEFRTFWGGSDTGYVNKEDRADFRRSSESSSPAGCLSAGEPSTGAARRASDREAIRAAQQEDAHERQILSKYAHIREPARCERPTPARQARSKIQLPDLLTWNRNCHRPVFAVSRPCRAAVRHRYRCFVPRFLTTIAHSGNQVCVRPITGRYPCR